MHARFVGSPEQQVLAALLALGEVQYFFVPLMGRHAPLDSRQSSNSLPTTRSLALFHIWHEALNMDLVAPGRDLNLAAVEALGPLGSLASQMALISFGPHDFARARHAKPLGRSLVSLDLWH
jgi:hypothetical protein